MLDSHYCNAFWTGMQIVVTKTSKGKQLATSENNGP